VLFITQVAGHLLGLGPVQQPVRQLIVDQPSATGSPASRLRATFAVSVIACPYASRNLWGPSSGHVTFTAGKTRPRAVGEW
jgi:hypothetical protein